MGRKLDLSGLTDAEAEHVLTVVQRDMRLRKAEEERLSEMKQELAEEGSRCSLLSKQQRFNEHCCIRCCAPFTFLLNTRRRCLDCRYNVCKGCRTYCQRDGAWLCSACQKGRVLRTQSLEWFYNNVKSRFKRFGSAKVLKTLYRKHIDERGALSLSDLPEGSVQECSNDNDDSVCGSDSAFYKQSEGHSMAETLTVALRVAEEAIEEAITKAEEFSDSLEKQNEARYLRDHKEELIEELATTIVQKIIQRRKRSVMQSDFDFVWPLQPQDPPSELPSPAPPQASYQDPLRTPYSLWRSRSAFSLTSDDSPEKGPEDQLGAGADRGPPDYTSLKRDTKTTSLPSWKSVDRLDNSSASSVLQSPDGNWIALQSSQLSRPGLLTKRKSLVFSMLEKESGVVSAYDEMGSESGGDNDDNDDNNKDDDAGGWGAALRQFRRKLSDETYYTDSQHDPEWTFKRHPAQPPPPPPPPPAVTSPSSGQYTNTETLNSDSEASGFAHPRKSMSPPHHHHHQNLLKKRGPPDTQLRPHQPDDDDEDGVFHQAHHQLPPEALDVNFNPKVMGDSSEADERPNDSVRRSRRRRKSKRESTSEQSRTHPIHPLMRENSSILLSALLKRSLSQDQPTPMDQPGPVDQPAPLPITPGTLESPEEAFLNSDPTSPEATERDPDTVAPNSLVPGPPALTPGGSGPPGYGPEGPLEEELRRSRPGLQSVGRTPNNMELLSSSEDESGKRPLEQTTDRASDRQEEREEEEKGEKRGTEDEKLRETPSGDAADHGGRTPEPQNGPERDRRERPAPGRSTREEGSARREKTSGENGGTSLESAVAVEHRDADNKGGNRAEKREGGRRQSKRRQKRGAEKKEAERMGLSGSSASGSPAVTPSALEGVLSDGQEGQHELELQQRLHSLSQQQQQYSAASLCSITTEVLKVLNATEELIGEAGCGDGYTTPSPISRCSDTTRLDQRLSKMEENVYLAASAVYGLEGALGDLEDCARSISSSTTDVELSFLEDQVATAAAQVQQSELQISNIEARISALKTAGLNVTACNRFSKYKPKPQTLDSSRHQRRKLPAPPLKEKLDQEQPVFRP